MSKNSWDLTDQKAAQLLQDELHHENIRRRFRLNNWNKLVEKNGKKHVGEADKNNVLQQQSMFSSSPLLSSASHSPFREYRTNGQFYINDQPFTYRNDQSYDKDYRDKLDRYKDFSKKYLHATFPEDNSVADSLLAARLRLQKDYLAKQGAVINLAGPSRKPGVLGQVNDKGINIYNHPPYSSANPMLTYAHENDHALAEIGPHLGENDEWISPINYATTKADIPYIAKDSQQLETLQDIISPTGNFKNGYSASNYFGDQPLGRPSLDEFQTHMMDELGNPLQASGANSRDDFLYNLADFKHKQYQTLHNYSGNQQNNQILLDSLAELRDKLKPSEAVNILSPIPSPRAKRTRSASPTQNSSLISPGDNWSTESNQGSKKGYRYPLHEYSYDPSTTQVSQNIATRLPERVDNFLANVVRPPRIGIYQPPVSRRLGIGASQAQQNALGQLSSGPVIQQQDESGNWVHKEEESKGNYASGGSVNGNYDPYLNTGSVSPGLGSLYDYINYRYARGGGVGLGSMGRFFGIYPSDY